MNVRGMGRAARTALAVGCLALVGGAARAATIKPTNLVSLLQQSEVIVAGTVESITDGVGETGLPYTEITISVSESLRGNVTDTFTFRQLGLQVVRPGSEPGQMLAAAPEGMPKYEIGENVLLFVGEQASMTGLRTTVGLGEGRFEVSAARAENDYSNAGLFQGVSVQTGFATENDTRLLQTTVGAVNGDDFLSLVRRAVQDTWIEKCLMWDSEIGKTCNTGPRRPGLTGKTTTTKSYPTLQIAR